MTDFLPRDWHNEPVTDTPIDAAGLKDLELRLAGYVDTRIPQAALAGVVAIANGAGDITWGLATDANIAGANIDGADGKPSMRTLGAGAGQAAKGSAAEYTANKGAANGYMGLDGGARGAQSPKLHASDHAGGADAILGLTSSVLDPRFGGGAKGDAQLVIDGNVPAGAGAQTLTSATGAFTAADVGKTVILGGPGWSANGTGDMSLTDATHITNATGTWAVGDVITGPAISLQRTGTITAATTVTAVAGVAGALTLTLSNPVLQSATGISLMKVQPAGAKASANGTGDTANGSQTVSNATGTWGMFYGITGPGIQDGTVVIDVNGTTLTLSKPAGAGAAVGGVLSRLVPLQTTVTGYTDANHVTIGAGPDIAQTAATVVWGTDDTNAFRQAFLLTSQKVRVPGRAYLLTGTLTQPGGLTVEGDGRGATTLYGYTAGNPVIQTVAAGGAVRPELHDMTLSFPTDAVANLVLYQDCTRARVEGVTAIGGRWGIHLHNATRGVIEDCEATQQRGAAIPVALYVSGTSKRCRITNGEAYDTAGLGIFLDSTTSTQTILGHRVEDNVVTNTGDNGIRVQTNPGGAVPQPPPGLEQRHVVVTGNEVEDPGINCIRVNGFYLAVVGNTLSGGQAAIRDTGVGSSILTRSTISGNDCYGKGQNFSGGIEFHYGADRMTITSNYVRGYAYGINWMGGAANISSNTVELNSRDGIALQLDANIDGANTPAPTGPKRCAVNGNHCMNNGQAGAGHAGIAILYTGATDIGVGGMNVCFDDQAVKTQSYGLQVANGADFLAVVGNDFRTNLTAAVNRSGGVNSTSNSLFKDNLGSDRTQGAVGIGGSPSQYINQTGRPIKVIITPGAGAITNVEYLPSGGAFESIMQTGGTPPLMIDLQPLDRFRVTYGAGGAPTAVYIPAP